MSSKFLRQSGLRLSLISLTFWTRRLRVANHIQAYKRKMAHDFKKWVRPRPLQKGDLVLRILRGLIGDLRGKFRPSWIRPYVIRKLTPEEIAWLTNLDGNQFSKLNNVDQLKKYDD